MNTTANTNPNTTKERIMSKIHLYSEAFNKRAGLFCTIYMLLLVVWLFLVIVTGSKATIHVLVFALSSALALRIVFYFFKAKGWKNKFSLEKFYTAIYTQEDFENFREGLTEELYKEMKNNAYVEISTEKQEIEKERAKMKAFLRKHNTAGVIFDDFEEKTMVDVGLYLGECFSELCYYRTLKDFVKFFDKNKEGFISEIYNTDVIFNEMVEGLAYYCLDKTTQKELRDLRKKIHKAYCRDGYEKIGIYDYWKEQQELAGENEATFRC